MEIRELTLRDRDAVTALFRDVFTAEPWNDDWSDAAQLEAYIADLTGQDNSLTLGFLDGEKLTALAMGHVKHWFRGTEYCIDEFCVDRHRQGQGIGTAFMAAVEDFLRARGIRAIFLQTDRSVPAYGFYTRRGFRELAGHVSFAKRVDTSDN